MRFARRLVSLLALTTLFLAISLVVISYYISGKILNPDTRDYDSTFQLELDRKRFTQEYYNSLPRDEVYIQSPYGYSLHGVYISNVGSRKTIIFSHGRTYSLMGSYKYVDMFRKRGFNVLLVDNRNHGKSGGENSTFGYYERNDINAWVDWVIENTGNDTLIGFHGESLGSVIGLMHMTVDNRVAFYILDSPMANLSSTIGHTLKNDFNLPAFPLIPMTSFMSKLRTGMSFDDVSPIQFISEIKTPVLFIHGADDVYSLSENSTQLFEAHSGKKKLWICPDAGHTQCVIVNREAYDKTVGEFLESIGQR